MGFPVVSVQVWCLEYITKTGITLVSGLPRAERLRRSQWQLYAELFWEHVGHQIHQIHQGLQCKGSANIRVLSCRVESNKAT